MGVAALGVLQSAVYMLMGLVAGAHLDAGIGGALVVLVLGSPDRGRRSARSAARRRCARAPAKAVQSLFPLFFVFIFLSSSSLPRNLLRTGWFHAVANVNPISYLIEAFRSLYIYGWDGTALWRGFAVVIGLTILALLAIAGALRTRLQRT